MNTRLHTSLSWLLALFANLLLATSLQAETRQDALNHYIKVFSTDPPHIQKDAAQELEWMGLSDPKLFDIVEKNLLAHYKDSDKEMADYAAWLAKALAFSGQSKYTTTLNEVTSNAANKNTRKHAGNALDILPKYTRWNAVISNNAGYNSAKSVSLNNYANMLKSGDRELQRMASKRISYEKVSDKWLLDILNTEAQKAISAPVVGDDDADAVSWMLRMLAMAPNHSEYRATLDNAAASAVDKSVRKNAASYIKKYY